MSAFDELDPETKEAIRQHFEAMARFERRETDACPTCGRTVTALEQVGRCVYSRPCGCRLWQGGVPLAWRVNMKKEDES